MIKKLLIAFAAILLIAIGGGYFYLSSVLPNVDPAPQLTIERTPERVERGKYLAHAVAVCMDCHSTRDWSKFSGPLADGTLGKGGEKFDQTMGFPGVFYSKNITPYGLKDWTDGEIYRVIVSGVAKNGRSMFPVMPYHNYGKMDQEDIYSMIAYIRTLDEIKNDVPDSKPDFPMNLIINTIPKKPNHQTRPDTTDMVAYGKYLVNASACGDCHTKVDDKGQFIPGTEMGGGREFKFGPTVIRSANITIHESGIGTWTETMFVNRFKNFSKDRNYVAPALTPGAFNSIMPWTMYSNMTETDLRAIYAYLKTVKTIDNTVKTFEVVQTK